MKAKKASGAGARPQRALLAVAALLMACGKAPPAQRPMPLDQRMLTAADFLLECMSSAGAECVAHSAASDAWSAHGDLEVVARVPAAVLSKYLSVAVDEMRRIDHVHRRVIDESRDAVRLTRRFPCRAHRARYVGAFFAVRRELLAQQARALGLHLTGVGADVAKLVETAALLDKAWLVTARCATSELFVLVAPTHELEPDDDPAAYPARGWQAITAATDPERLLRGYGGAPRSRAPRVADRAPSDSIDPWLPVMRTDL
jgi:hypothetical protein